MADDPRASFGRVAANYSRSTFHTSSDRLQEVVDLVRPLKGDLVLDVATGTGNTALALAPLVRRGVGLDLTPEMLEGARRVTAGGGVRQGGLGVGDARVLPFARETFHVYVVQGSPHHFPPFDE